MRVPGLASRGSCSRQFVEQTVLGWRSVEGSSLSSVIVGEVGQLGLRKGICGSEASNLAAYGEGNYAITQLCIIPGSSLAEVKSGLEERVRKLGNCVIA